MFVTLRGQIVKKVPFYQNLCNILTEVIFKNQKHYLRIKYHLILELLHKANRILESFHLLFIKIIKIL